MLHGAYLAGEAKQIDEAFRVMMIIQVTCGKGSDGFVVQGIRAVSYTHLDVYKRQHISEVFCSQKIIQSLFCQSLRFFINGGSLVHILQDEDVYKRQDGLCDNGRKGLFYCSG